MSNREHFMALAKAVPDYKLSYAIAYLQGLVADEDADQAFCQALYQAYLDDPDPEKDQMVSLEDAAKEWGIAL